MNNQNSITWARALEPSVFTREDLMKEAVLRQEGVIAANAALAVTTGSRTGRSPKDRFIVEDSLTKHTVNWGVVNQPIVSTVFDALWEKVATYLAKKDKIFVSSLRVGAAAEYAVGVKVITEYAWHQLFVHNLFICESLHSAEWTMMVAPEFHPDPVQDGVNGDAAIILNFEQKCILICGTQYAGEMKKAMFTVLNYLLPEKNVLPMHCSANVGKQGDSALFFGLSGTGKTTLSADPERFLIGDDEHGWAEDKIFNFEGGCYAKCINLSAQNEPMIYQAIRQGAVMENVVLDAAAEPQYADATYTQNTRAAYPLSHIDSRVPEAEAGIPSAVVFLTCDLYGVLPPVALLSPEQAAYHFLSGYTALVGSTEVGQIEPIKQTFSACFGEPFFPRHPQVYAELLIEKVRRAGAQVYLVNTGWTGGAYSEGGERFSIPVTRKIIDAVLSGALLQTETQILPGFNLQIPLNIAGVAPTQLDPRTAWDSETAYQEKLRKLIALFQANFKKFGIEATSIVAAGPEEI